MKKNILIVGGDLRQKHLEDILTEKGYICKRENTDADNAYSELTEAPAVILPVPVSSDGKHIYSDNPSFNLDISDFLNCIKPEQLVLGGMIKGEIKEIFERNNVVYKDVCRFEHFTKYNAFLTVQGAVKLLLDTSDRLISGKKVLITGFGRIGKALAQTLKSMNMDVFVAARSKEQLTESVCTGYKAIHLKDLSSVIYLFDYIFNTVPENIFTESDVSHIRPDSIYFELASKPYGAEKTYFLKENKRYVFGGGLPGKYVARSAAEIIAEFVVNML